MPQQHSSTSHFEEGLHFVVWSETITIDLHPILIKRSKTLLHHLESAPKQPARTYGSILNALSIRQINKYQDVLRIP